MTKQEKSDYDSKRYALKRVEIRNRQNTMNSTVEKKASKRAYDIRYREVNKDTIRKRKQSWKNNNPKKRRAGDNRYRENNRERVNSTGNKARTTEQTAFYNRTARMRRRNAPGSHTPKDWQDIIVRQRGICAICKKERKMTKDHIVPVSRGGSNDPSNLQGLCASCNSRKAARLMSEIGGDHIHLGVI